MLNTKANWLFLQPGDIYFKELPITYKTTLGSCIAMTFWHPRLPYSGMLHYLLPNSSHYTKKGIGHYGDLAVQFMIDKMAEKHTLPQEYSVGVYGAITGLQSKGKISAKNIEFAKSIVAESKFNLTAFEVGKTCLYHKLKFDASIGEVHSDYGEIFE